MSFKNLDPKSYTKSFIENILQRAIDASNAIDEESPDVREKTELYMMALEPHVVAEMMSLFAALVDTMFDVCDSCDSCGHRFVDGITSAAIVRQASSKDSN